MGHKVAFYSEGQTTYYVKGQRFFNDKGLRNGRQRALEFCAENNINPDEIITFDSILECDRYEYLLVQEISGKIKNLKHHLKLPLLPSYTNFNGDEIPALEYNADFVYEENGKKIVEDVKGASLFNDSRFEAIKQIFDYVYRSKTYIRIIIRRDKEWVEWKLGESKKPRKLIKKQSEKNKELKKQNNSLEVEKRRLERLKIRYKELKAKDKLTSVEKKRLIEIEKELLE